MAAASAVFCCIFPISLPFDMQQSANSQSDNAINKLSTQKRRNSRVPEIENDAFESHYLVEILQNVLHGSIPAPKPTLRPTPTTE